MHLELISRKGCHLCEEAASALLASGHSYEERDVDADAELLRLYDFRVPVILRDGQVLAEGRIDPARLAHQLAP